MLLNDLESFDINTVYKSERSFLKRRALPLSRKIEEFPATYQQTIQCKKLTEEDLLLKVATTKETVRCNVIQKQEIGTFTERITKEIPVENGLLQWQKANCALLIVMERYGKMVIFLFL